jgi:pimeloyl-ACP methyl ester carboxylesterase
MITLDHTTAGPQAGPAVVLLHGLASAARTWSVFTAVLPTRSHALDLRGHGGSPHAGDYSLETMADDVLAFLDTHDLATVDLVGHSMGGAVALLVARRAPARVRRMVIEDAPPPPLEPVESYPPPPSTPPEPVDFDWAALEPIIRQVRTPDPAWWSALPTITTPTLWLRGGPTSHVDQNRITMAANRMPTATVVEIPAGHHIHREAPTEFANAVLPFLATGRG